MNMTTESSATADREIVVTRVFDAPRELVFAAWTDPNHIAEWWGPTGFRTTTRAMDFRPGGVWRFVMHGPDGRDYENRITYDEIIQPERLVYHHDSGEDVEDVGFQVTGTFDEDGGKTKLTMRMLFPSADERDRVIKEYGALEGAHQTLDRLVAHIARLSADSADGKAFIISRVFAAPRDLVFNAWTVPEHLARWWGPHGFTNPVCEVNLRPGGSYRFVMRSPDGVDYPMKGFFMDIVTPEKLVMTIDCRDHPPEWHRMVNPGGDPAALDSVMTVTFEEVAVKQTRVTIRTLFKTKEIRDSFVKIGMVEGWTGSLEKLEALLAS